MPQRDDSGYQGRPSNVPSRPNRTVPQAPVPTARSSRAVTNSPAPRAQRSPQPPASDEAEDAWDEVMDMKCREDDSKFNKMNTNFYLKDGEVADVVFLDESPTIFWGHTVKCTTQDGRDFYRTEQCQKSQQDYCVLCESDNPSVSKAKKVLAFRLLDGRGSWDKKLNNGKGGLDGVACPKIFLIPLYLAKQIKALRDDAGTISDKVMTLTKNQTYVATFKYKKQPDGSMRYIMAKEYEEELPEVLSVYKCDTDADIMDFIRKFGAGGGGAARGAARGGARPAKAGGGLGADDDLPF